MVQWLARLPGTQGIRGSSRGRGMTDFCQYSFVYIQKKIKISTLYISVEMLKF